jgi:hypothetical protein
MVDFRRTFRLALLLRVGTTARCIVLKYVWLDPDPVSKGEWMSAPQMPDAVRRIFTESFTVKDVAEPLASFDASAPAQEVRAFMERQSVEVIGVRQEGRIAGFVERASLDDRTCGQCQRPLDDAACLDANAPLLNVLTQLGKTPFLFVTAFGTVAGIVTRADMQKPPVRMWLFGIVTLIEMRFGELIERHCPGDSWRQYLSEARLQKAQTLLEERRRRN